tara:strand:- start:3898 stop:4473 length:576 start_codon:yes stop_codon:yes gene_type:complete
MLLQFNGYHGTNLSAAKQIISSNYELSVGDDEWLGDGVYFFIKGISSTPEVQAEKWAIAHSWDNTRKARRYKRFCVLSSVIQVEEENFLDLTNEDGVEILSYLFDKFEKKLKKLGKGFKPVDGLLINLAVGEGILPIEVVKGNFYIKFAKERIKRINLRTSNSTICTVYNPIKNIISSNIIKIGDIKDETK